MNAIKLLGLGIALGIITVSCSDEGEISPIEKSVITGRQDLLEAEFLTEISEKEIDDILQGFPHLSDLSNALPVRVDVYRLAYLTKNYDGQVITASGLALIPSTSNAPLLSYQHGTILKQSEAPSAFATSNGLLDVLTLFATYGYIVSAPDYIGYGLSSGLPHPFEHDATMGSSSFDMLMATRELVSLLDKPTSGKVFLAGYSQGGYATMAMHRYLEANSDLSVTMSAPGAGAYNKSGTVAALEDQDISIDNPGAWLWNIDVINRTSGVNRPWSEILQEPNLSMFSSTTDPMRLPTLANLDRDPRNLFRPEFIQGLSTGEDEEMLEAFRANDNHDWAPKGPITLYFGTADKSVFPFHAESAYEALSVRSDKVQLVRFPGATHNSAVEPYWLSIFELFERLR